MFVVIMAGGSGTRFWPSSRKARPKQFLNLTGKGPMLVETCDRLGPLARDEEMILVLGREHLPPAQDLLKGRNVHLVGEPVGRNTAPCIGLGALQAEHLGYRGPIAFLPADHFIGDVPAFLTALRKAAKIAESGAIVTLGIVPTRPETGYGYIRKSASQSDFDEIGTFRVAAFVEKPDFETARQYLASGEYFWNAGIFVASTVTILRTLKQHLPDLHEGLMQLQTAIGTPSYEREMETVYPALTSISFDCGVMERTADPVFVIPSECGWSDVGSWLSLHELRSKAQGADKNVAEGDTLLVDCRETLVSAQGARLVACLGLENCLVVDTPEALLVADLRRSQEVRRIVAALKEGHREDLL
jgi:mannose-1-phosphate guanylyltransferase